MLPVSFLLLMVKGREWILGSDRAAKGEMLGRKENGNEKEGRMGPAIKLV